MRHRVHNQEPALRWPVPRESIVRHGEHAYFPSEWHRDAAALLSPDAESPFWRAAVHVLVVR